MKLSPPQKKTPQKNKPFVGHGKLRWIGNILVLWTNKILYFQFQG